MAPRAKTPAAPAPAPARARINRRQLLELVPGIQYGSLWRLWKAGRFPAPHHIMGKVFWFEDEVQDWVRLEMAKGPRNRVPPMPVVPMVTR